jgi:hypothetical protein
VPILEFVSYGSRNDNVGSKRQPLFKLRVGIKSEKIIVSRFFLGKTRIFDRELN